MNFGDRKWFPNRLKHPATVIRFSSAEGAGMFVGTPAADDNFGVVWALPNGNARRRRKILGSIWVLLRGKRPPQAKKWWFWALLKGKSFKNSTKPCLSLSEWFSPEISLSEWFSDWGGGGVGEGSTHSWGPSEPPYFPHLSPMVAPYQTNRFWWRGPCPRSLEL